MLEALKGQEVHIHFWMVQVLEEAYWKSWMNGS